MEEVMLSEEKIVENWDKLMEIIEETFSGERKDNIIKMHEYFQDRMSMAPASSFEHFHNAFPGGYVDHILNVIEFSKRVTELWREAGARIDFTNEELVFSAMFHDLGKVGDLFNDLYIPNESEWHRNNQGRIYILNPKVENMSVTDLSYMLLNHFGIKYNLKEMMGIRLADGMYADYNKSYLVAFESDKKLKTNLPFIIHEADFLALHVEYDTWKYSDTEKQEKKLDKPSNKGVTKRKETLKEAVAKAGGTVITDAVFDDIFGV